MHARDNRRSIALILKDLETLYYLIEILLTDPSKDIIVEVHILIFDQNYLHEI